MMVTTTLPRGSTAGQRTLSGTVIAATALGFALVQLDVSIVNVALATIGRDLHAGIAVLQWVVDAYAVTFAALLLLGGALGDRIGARRVLLAGFAIFISASAGCGFAPNGGVLLGARVLAGVGAALLVPCSLALLNRACGDDPRLRAQAIGLWTAAGSVALALGPIAGGLLVSSMGWRSIFLVNVPIGCASIWLIVRSLRETRPSAGRFDLPGQVLAIASLGTLIAGVISAGTRGWASPVVVLECTAALVGIALFVYLESRSPAPMLPLDLFGRPAFSMSIVAGFAINLTLYGTIFVLGLDLQRREGYSPLQTGLAFLPFCAVLGLANVLAGRLVARYGARPPMIAGLVVAAIGDLALLIAGTHPPYTALLAGLLIVPLGIGTAVPAMTTALLASVEKSRAGIASGVLNMIRQAAGAIGVALFGSLLAAHGVNGLHTDFIVSAMLVGLAAVFAGFARGRAARTDAS